MSSSEFLLKCRSVGKIYGESSKLMANSTDEVASNDGQNLK